MQFGNATFEACSATGNTTSGINSGDGAVLIGCHANANTGEGFRLGEGSHAT